MKPKERIVKFIEQQHVLSLTVKEADGNLWASNAFYVFDEAVMSFYILSELKTSHAKAMLLNPEIVGTVSTTPKTVLKIQGIQYRALASKLEGDAAKQAYSIYYQTFPFARVLNAPIWQLKLYYVKMTNNLLGFAHKEIWREDEV